MKSYFMLLLLLLAAKHEADTGTRKICVLSGRSEKLFPNVTLDYQKERWALYANGAVNNILIAIWRLNNSSTPLEELNNNININMDKNRNIWINDVSKEDGRKYSIKYISDHTFGPEVELAVFGLPEDMMSEGCQDSQTLTMTARTTSFISTETTTASLAIGNILTATLPEKAAYPTADNSSSQRNDMTPGTVVLVVLSTILVTIFTVGLLSYCLFKTGRLKWLSPSNNTPGDESGESQQLDKLKLHDHKIEMLTKDLEYIKRRLSVENAGDVPTIDLAMCNGSAQVMLADEPSTDQTVDERSESDEHKPFLNQGVVGTSLPALITGDGVTISSPMCIICSDNDKCVKFMPCGHTLTCTDCAPALRKCPECKESIKGMVKEFSLRLGKKTALRKHKLKEILELIVSYARR